MRRKIKLAFIENDAARKASFKKRRGGLMKKVRELTILCDVSACIVINGTGEFGPVSVWPNEDEARRLIRRFRRVPEMEQCKKMATQETYLRDQAGKINGQIQKLLELNRDTVIAHVMRQIGTGEPLDEIGSGELNGVLKMLEERTEEAQKRITAPSLTLTLTFPPKLRALSAEEIAGRRDFPLEWMFKSLPERDFLTGFGGNIGNIFPAGNEFLDLGYGNYNNNNNMGFEGTTLTLPTNNNYATNNNNNNDNVGLGFFQSSGSEFVNNGVNMINMFDYINSGYKAGVQGLSPSNNNNDFIVNPGFVSMEIDHQGSGSGTSIGSGSGSDDNNADLSNYFAKYWSPFYSPTP